MQEWKAEDWDAGRGTDVHKGQRGQMAKGTVGLAARWSPTVVWMVRAKSPAQLQYTGMLVSFTPRHFRQI